MLTAWGPLRSHPLLLAPSDRVTAPGSGGCPPTTPQVALRGLGAQREAVGHPVPSPWDCSVPCVLDPSPLGSQVTSLEEREADGFLGMGVLGTQHSYWRERSSKTVTLEASFHAPPQGRNNQSPCKHTSGAKAVRLPDPPQTPHPPAWPARPRCARRRANSCICGILV